jgi:hypothetical protein
MVKRIWLLIGIAALAVGALLVVSGWSSGADADSTTALGFSILAIGVAVLVTVIL